MSRIPTKESDLMALAEAMMGGLKNNASLFPAPPISPEEMDTQLNNFTLNRDNVLAAKAAYEAAVDAKNIIFKTIDETVRDNAYYCKKVAEKNDSFLTLVGLSATRRKEDEAPGQCGDFEVIKQGEGWATFEWKRPDDGGKPRAYKIERKNNQTDNWEIAAMAMETTAEVSNQTIGESFGYRVIASNRRGDGIVSNTVTVKF